GARMPAMDGWRRSGGAPLRDARGNELVGFHRAPAGGIAGVVGGGAPPLALMAAVFRGAVLLVFDRGRGQWELPGGRIEPGESPRRAAHRELREEAGRRTGPAHLAGMAEFDLATPVPGVRRREFAAVYRARLRRAGGGFVPNAEIAGVTLWRPGDELPGASPLDTRIAGLALRTAAP
ncbi:NUDIX hydrolase, partial [Marinitenerispora sediminis]